LHINNYFFLEFLITSCVLTPNLNEASTALPQIWQSVHFQGCGTTNSVLGYSLLKGYDMTAVTAVNTTGLNILFSEKDKPVSPNNCY
jgi:hypothetical protein